MYVLEIHVAPLGISKQGVVFEFLCDDMMADDRGVRRVCCPGARFCDTGPGRPVTHIWSRCKSRSNVR